MTTNPESLLAVTQAKAITAEILGYKDWDDATDYRTTGAQDRERDLVLAIVSKALATRPAPPAQPGREEVVEAMARITDPDAWHESLPTDGCGSYWTSRRKKAKERARAALSAAEPLLARQDVRPEAEPVAWMYKHADGRRPFVLTYRRLQGGDGWTEIPLYPEPPTLPTEPASVREEVEREIIAWLRLDEHRGSYKARTVADAIERGEHRAALSTEEPKL